MTTSDIALERVQALLKVETGNGSLYDHLVKVVRKLAEEKPNDALSDLEVLSRHLKQSSFRGDAASDDSQPVAVDAIAEQLRQEYCVKSMQLVKRPSDPSSSPKVLAAVQNFIDDAAMFEWAGVGFGKQESFHMAMSLRQLATDTPSLESLRLWGKILGTDGDYYVAEGILQSPAVAGPAPASPWVLPDTPEYDVEPRGQGPNTYAYWVCQNGPTSGWTRLPAARASQVKAARKIQRLMTGNLDADVQSTPFFPGQERHLLRAQIARITATCTLAPTGWYEEDVDDENPKPPKSIKMVDDPLAAFPSQEELEKQDAWVHASPFLLPSGRSSWPSLDAAKEAMEADPPPAALTQKIKDFVNTNIASWEQEIEKDAEAPNILSGIGEDLGDRKPDDAESTPAWTFKTHGDKGKYFNDKEEEVVHRVVAARSMVWPGAVTVAQGKKFANLYVGYAQKCGTLVPGDKTSGLPLPLSGTCPFDPLVPADIMEEPEDEKEEEEPNPQEKDAESDKGSVEEE